MFVQPRTLAMLGCADLSLGRATMRQALSRGYQVVHDGRNSIEGTHRFQHEGLNRVEKFLHFMGRHLERPFGPTLLLIQTPPTDVMLAHRELETHFEAPDMLGFLLPQPVVEGHEQHALYDAHAAAMGRYVSLVRSERGVPAFTVGHLPYALEDVPESEVLVAQLLMGATKMASQTGVVADAFKLGLATFLQRPLPRTPLQILYSLLGADLVSSDAFAWFKKKEAQNILLKNGAEASLGVLIEKLVREGNVELLQPAFEALWNLDWLGRPDRMAIRLLAQFESERLPEDGILRLYNEREQNPTLIAMQSPGDH